LGLFFSLAAEPTAGP